MDKISVRLTVFFENPFWVGVFERVYNGNISAFKITFGAEPKDYEVFDFIMKSYYSLRFSPAVATDVKETCKNPKRTRREIRKQVVAARIETKSQRALKLQQEQCKTERRERHRDLLLQKKERRFILKQQKRKEKHRGR